MLAPLGVHLTEAENGQEAIEQAAACHPDLIFLDLKMPVMDGYEAARRIREAKASVGAPSFAGPSPLVIIAFSAGAYDTIRQQSLEAGCDDFLAKPFHMKELFAILEKYLRVEWETEPAVQDTPDAKQPWTLPPPENVRALYEAALMGDILEIRAQLAELDQRNPAFKPFVVEFQELSKHFQLAQMREKLEAFLEQEPFSTERTVFKGASLARVIQ